MLPYHLATLMLIVGMVVLVYSVKCTVFPTIVKITNNVVFFYFVHAQRVIGYGKSIFNYFILTTWKIFYFFTVICVIPIHEAVTEFKQFTASIAIIIVYSTIGDCTAGIFIILTTLPNGIMQLVVFNFGFLFASRQHEATGKHN